MLLEAGHDHARRVVDGGLRRGVYSRDLERVKIALHKAMHGPPRLMLMLILKILSSTRFIGACRLIANLSVARRMFWC